MLSGINASLKVGWHNAAQLLNWSFNGNFEDWTFSSNIKSTEDFWFENSYTFDIIIPLNSGDLIFKNATLIEGDSTYIRLKGKGNPIRE